MNLELLSTCLKLKLEIKAKDKPPVESGNRSNTKHKVERSFKKGNGQQYQILQSMKKTVEMCPKKLTI